MITAKRSLINEVVDRVEASEPFRASLGSERVVAYISPIGRGADAYYLAMMSEHELMSLLNNITRKILWVGLASFLLTALLASIVGSRITQPVMELVQGMNRVKQGDLQVQLVRRGQDEIGQLTAEFNEMIRVLKERLTLKKYVGEHTLNMIQSEEDEKTLSRGKRMEVAVLFTDIRNFTRFSEEHEPEAVVDLLNTFLGFQAELVEEHGGDVDKYVGDEMFALFTGARALQTAFLCAREIQEKSLPFNRRYGGKVGLGDRDQCRAGNHGEHR